MSTIYKRGNKLYVGFKNSAGKWQYAATGLDSGQEREAKKLLGKIAVKMELSGDAQVTEYDGEQWKVLAATGSARPLHPEQDRGVDAHTKASPVYTKDDGEEEYFFGRGYVQLTWWNSYAAAGVALGRGPGVFICTRSRG
jgi:hypothetical protein